MIAEWQPNWCRSRACGECGGCVGLAIERATAVRAPLVSCQSAPQQSCLCRRGGNGGLACRTLLHRAGLIHREAKHDGSEYRCQPCLRASAAYWKEKRDA